ncbi:beta-lactamase family protein [Stackebrandtia albiflava]|uniref:Beta-lactamase n=1 Tax=Stackebrandtia albiflava TaxID=406432 RepID=A0A562VBK7_9ACTN|nr:serine hydrolase [Stackebrandtia albiflava]TWJ15240.1 beta-lactamase family protein [Stackebrandtia albiflava]
MPMSMSRRSLLELGAVTAAGAVVPSPARSGEDEAPASDPEEAADRIRAVFTRYSEAAGGWWRARISVNRRDGSAVDAIDRESGRELEAWSTNKVPVAIAVMRKVDDGEFDVDRLLDVTARAASHDGDGIFVYDDAYPSHVTVGHVLANMLTVSDDTAVRLCAELVTADEVDGLMSAHGFTHTRVQETAGGGFLLGRTTPGEQHDLWRALMAGELLSAESTGRIVRLARSPEAFTDGIRLRMPTPQRLRVATKAGWFDAATDERCEAGVIADSEGAAVMTYSLYAGDQGAAGDFGATHPANAARAAMGHRFARIVSRLPGSGMRIAP